MKVLFCLGSLNKGGAERVVCNLANYFVEKNNEVAIIITMPCKNAYRLNKNINVFTLDESTNDNKILRNIKRINKLKSIIINYKPDVMFGFLQEPIGRLLVLKKLSRKIKRIPLIVSIRIDPKTAFNTFKRRLSLMLYDEADGFVFQTKEARDFFKKSIQDRSVVIANPVDTSFLRKNTSEIKRSKRVVSVGRLTEQKNYPMLIDAFNRISCEFSDYSLEIYGDGPLKNELGTYIKENGLKNRVLLMGSVDNLANRISDASLFVITSDYEGLSNALMEAMTLGIPSISTDSAGGGAASLISDGENGFLVRVNDTDELVNKMRLLLSDEKLAKKISSNSVKSMRFYNPEKINTLWYNYTMRIYEGKNRNGK